QDSRAPGCRRPRLNRQSGEAPLRKPFEQTLRATPARTQQFDGAVRVDAIRAPAVRDVSLVLWKLPETTLQLVDRNGNSTGDVPRRILVRRPRVQDDDVPRTRTSQQIGYRDRLGIRALAEVFADQAVELGAPPRGDRAERHAQFHD